MADRSFGNYSSCCRLCLSENSNSLKSVFDSASNRPLSEQIQTCMGIEIKESDKLSTMICQSCICKLDQWDQYKSTCLENQGKLESWLNAWDSHQIVDMCLQIKDEAVDDDSSTNPVRVIVNETGRRRVSLTPAHPGNSESGNFLAIQTIKEEPMDTDISQGDCFEDLPPPLTPHPPEERMVVDSHDDDADSQANSEVEDTSSIEARSCTICDKVFSTVSNRKKHERTIHGRRNRGEGFDEDATRSSEGIIEDDNGSVHSGISRSQDETGARSFLPVTDNVNENGINESDHQKIQFAAKLKLQLQHHASPSPNPYSFGGFTKIEHSYIEKCKAMIKMNETFICVCHNEQHQSFKQILQHIRKNPIWFPCYTCFNCMITFTDRSTYMKHYVSCPKEKLQNLKRLAATTENNEMKVRLYQVYMCVICNFVFTYHEDFCQHINVVHVSESEMDTECKKCGTAFETADAVRRHMYLSSCLMNYRCDICWKSFGSMTEFKVHCEQEHDTSEGFSLEYNENFRKRSVVYEVNRKADDIRRRSQDVSKLEVDNPDASPEAERVLNPHAVVNKQHINSKNRRSACHICGKVYSNYHNMLRHAKTHDESYNTLKCNYCEETFRLMVHLRQHENEVHNAQNSPDQSPVPKPTPRITREFRFTCPECGSSFRDVNDFMKHKETHKLPCEECGKMFDTQAELDQHRSVHLNIKVYRDSKTHNYKSSMVSALLMCEVCDKVFSSKNDLCQHKLLHEEMPVLTAQDDMDEEDKKDNTKKYTCDICNKTYLGYGGLWDHNNKHHPGRKIPREYPRQCNYCDKMLFTGGSWYMHKQMHERLSQQALNITNMNGDDDDDDVSHVNSSFRSPRRSIKEEEDAESYFTCNKCFKVFSSRSNLRNHMKCHGIGTSPSSRTQVKTGKAKTYWCDVCHQACQGLAELQKHKQEHVNEGASQLNDGQDGEEEEPKKLHIFLCDICDKDFTTKFALKKHKERHDLECSPIQRKRYFYCKYCKIPFKNMTILEEHMQGEHNETVTPKPAPAPNPVQNKHPCAVCKKVFDTASALSSHQGWHKRGKVDKQMRTQQKFFRKMVNEIPKKDQVIAEGFRCLTCSMHFPNDTALQIHILEAHRNVNTSSTMPSRCDPCNLNFDSQAAYEKHLQLHKVVEQQQQQKKMENAGETIVLKSGEVTRVMKNHPCKYCPSQFSRSDTLNAHMKEKHREHVQTVFTCTQCDRIFEKQNALSTHLKVHERQRQSSGDISGGSLGNLPKKYYACSICHVGFEIAKDLRNHIISTHPF